MMPPQRVESLGHAERERLVYIDLGLYFMDEIGRPDLASRFGVVPAGATQSLFAMRIAHRFEQPQDGCAGRDLSGHPHQAPGGRPSATTR